MIIDNKNIISLHKSFEKLTKVALIKIDQQQVSDVIRILNEFDEILSLFLERKNKNRSKFIELFINDPLPENIKTSLSEIETEFIRLYIVSFIKIWQTSYRNQSFDITKASLLILNKGFVNFRNENEHLDDIESINKYYECNQAFLDFFDLIISETTIKEDLNLIGEFLYKYILWITEIKNPFLLESYLKLLMNPVNSVVQDHSTITLDSSLLNEPSSEGIQVLCDMFFNIWNKAFEKNFENTTYNVVSIIEKVLTAFLSQENQGKDYISIANYFIRLIQSINTLINKGSNTFSTSAVKASYYWFFNIVFKEDFNLNLISNLQIPLFISIKTAILNNNKKLFVSFIEHIISGLYYPTYSMLTDIDYRTKWEIIDFSSIYNENKNDLLTLSSRAITLQDYQKVIIAYKSFETLLNNYALNIGDENKQSILSGYKLYIEKEFKYHRLQQTVIWLGTYCLFLKMYDYIYELLYANQPKDSTVNWINQDINPLNIWEILELYFRRHELDRDITFLWEGHHEFLTYYDSFLAILLMNAINQNQRKGDSDRNEYAPDFIRLGKSVQEIESISYSLDSLCQILESLKNNVPLLDGCGLSINLAESAISLLKNSRQKNDEIKDKLLLSDEIDPQKAQNFIDNVYESYNRGGSMKNIINQYKEIDKLNQPFPGKKIPTSSINEITPKSFFAKNDEGWYVGWPNAFAHQFLFNENMSLKRSFIDKCHKLDHKVDQSMIVDELEQIGGLSDKVLIFSNVYPSYEIFGSKTDFVPAFQIPEGERPTLHEFVGRYKGADIYSYYDDTDWKQLLVVNRHSEQGIGLINYFVPTDKEGYNIKEHFYWAILDLNKEDELVEEFIRKQPQWLIKQESNEEKQREFLKKQVNVKILYKMNLDLPDGFEGWFINL